MLLDSPPNSVPFATENVPCTTGKWVHEVQLYCSKLMKAGVLHTARDVLRCFLRCCVVANVVFPAWHTDQYVCTTTQISMGCGEG